MPAQRSNKPEDAKIKIYKPTTLQNYTSTPLDPASSIVEHAKKLYQKAPFLGWIYAKKSNPKHTHRQTTKLFKEGRQPENVGAPGNATSPDDHRSATSFQGIAASKAKQRCTASYRITTSGNRWQKYHGWTVLDACIRIALLCK